MYFAELALSRGFAVASLDSVNRVDRQWNASFNQTNPDVQNVAALIAELRTRGVITQQTRIVGQGTSNGGGFVTRVSALLAFDAQAIVIASGINPIVRAAQIPTCWVLNRNDSNSGVGAQAIVDATASAATLTSQGVRNQLWILEASPVYPERFTRVRALTIADSRAVYELLRSKNALDSNDFLIVHPDTLTGLALPAPASAHATEIADQLKIAYAEHHFSSNFMHLQLDFLEGRVFASSFE